MATAAYRVWGLEIKTDFNNKHLKFAYTVVSKGLNSPSVFKPQMQFIFPHQFKYKKCYDGMKTAVTNAKVVGEHYNWEHVKMASFVKEKKKMSKHFQHVRGTFQKFPRIRVCIGNGEGRRSSNWSCPSM